MTLRITLAAIMDTRSFDDMAKSLPNGCNVAHVTITGDDLSDPDAIRAAFAGLAETYVAAFASRKTQPPRSAKVRYRRPKVAGLIGWHWDAEAGTFWKIDAMTGARREFRPAIPLDPDMEDASATDGEA